MGSRVIGQRTRPLKIPEGVTSLLGTAALALGALTFFMGWIYHESYSAGVGLGGMATPIGYHQAAANGAVLSLYVLLAWVAVLAAYTAVSFMRGRGGLGMNTQQLQFLPLLGTLALASFAAMVGAIVALGQDSSFDLPWVNVAWTDLLVMAVAVILVWPLLRAIKWHKAESMPQALRFALILLFIVANIVCLGLYASMSGADDANDLRWSCKSRQGIVITAPELGHQNATYVLLHSDANALFLRDPNLRGSEYDVEVVAHRYVESATTTRIPANSAC